MRTRAGEVVECGVVYDMPRHGPRRGFSVPGLLSFLTHTEELAECDATDKVAGAHEYLISTPRAMPKAVDLPLTAAQVPRAVRVLVGCRHGAEFALHLVVQSRGLSGFEQGLRSESPGCMWALTT